MPSAMSSGPETSRHAWPTAPVVSRCPDTGREIAWNSGTGTRETEKRSYLMKHISLGGLDVSRIGLGAMSMSGYYNTGAGSDSASIRTIHRALDLGVTP